MEWRNGTQNGSATDVGLIELDAPVPLVSPCGVVCHFVVSLFLSSPPVCLFFLACHSSLCQASPELRAEGGAEKVSTHDSSPAREGDGETRLGCLPLLCPHCAGPAVGVVLPGSHDVAVLCFAVAL